MFRKNSYFHRSVFLAVVLVITISLFSLALTQPVAAQSARSVSTVQAKQADVYWTPERLTVADPVNPGRLTIEPVRQPDGPPVTRAGQEGITPLGFAQPVPTDDYPWIGKLFFHNPATGSDSWCSGAALTSNNKNTVNTAAHCLYSPADQVWMENVVFCPHFSLLEGQGYCPFGMWNADRLAVHASWGGADGQTPTAGYDYGAIAVTPNVHGDLTDVVGSGGWAYNLPVAIQRAPIGYPSNLNSGNVKMRCTPETSALRSDDPRQMSVFPCDLRHGSSGGPWLTNDGIVNGHVSNGTYYYLYSPIYDSAWFSVFDGMQNT